MTGPAQVTPATAASTATRRAQVAVTRRAQMATGSTASAAATATRGRAQVAATAATAPAAATAAEAGVALVFVTEATAAAATATAATASAEVTAPAMARGTLMASDRAALMAVLLTDGLSEGAASEQGHRRYDEQGHHHNSCDADCDPRQRDRTVVHRMPSPSPCRSDLCPPPLTRSAEHRATEPAAPVGCVTPGASVHRTVEPTWKRNRPPAVTAAGHPVSAR